MSARQELNAYIDNVARRLRVSTASRGAAMVAGAAFVVTIVLVAAMSVAAFSKGSVTVARFALVAALVSAAILALVRPLRRVTRPLTARQAERACPQFEQRLETFVDRQADEPFLDLLAADALNVARTVPPETLAPNRLLLSWLAGTAVSIAALVWLVTAKPGFLGHGANLLWTGSHAAAAALTDVQVSPGDATIRRNTDQLITAQTPGLLSPQVTLYARYQSSARWERVVMQPRSGASGYQFVLTGVPDNVEYYVEAGPRRSRHFSLHVIDLPNITRLKVTYHYPSWSGLKDSVEDPAGDLRALEGTRADLDVVTDRPLPDGLLVLDGGAQVRLSGSGNEYHGSVPIDRDGAYHVAALDRGQAVRMSEDYFIEARKAKPPDIAISRPAGDYRASPIEEVTVAVKAKDEFGLMELDLHYSVNGGPEKAVRLLRQAGEKESSGSTVLALEDFKLVPGDLVSVYATAKDARLESRTDIAFIQVDPFEREFSQSQQSGGGGGGGGGGQGVDPTEISRREKEMIAATFKQQGDRNATRKQAESTAKFLADAQATLRNQSLSLAGRLEARDLTRENKEFSSFQTEMAAAADAMAPAATRLQQQKWQEAIPEEQKALQHLLRAEATFRQIEVAFGSGGGGGGGGAGRDLASLFDLELDTQKNQYETQQSASSADQRAQDINDALKKLDELARRQDQLAAEQRNNSAQSFEQRWQQEMLQREAEQLQREIEQLSRRSGQNGQQSGAPASGSESAPGTPGGQSAESQAAGEARTRQQQQAAQQALDRLRQAQDEMRRAAADPRAASDARLAAERLREASGLLGGMQSQVAAGRLGLISKEADRLSAEEKKQAEGVTQLKQRGNDPSSAGDIRQLAADRQRLADDLSTLQQDMRNAARELDAGQRAASGKLRQALQGLDDNDVETRLQRTADWLRTGIDPTSNGTESQIASGLQRLSDEVHQAQQALVAGGQQQGAGTNAEAALDNVERLRRQIESLSGRGQQQGGERQDQSGQNQGRQNYQTGSLSRDGQSGQSPGPQNGQGQSGAGTGRGQGAENRQAGQGGDDGNRQAGAGRTGTLYGDYDTGNNARPGPPRAAPPQTTHSVDAQQTIQQGVSELNQMRRDLGNNPEMERQIQELIAAMEHLDLRRFPGNPAMVEELHQRLLSGIDTLELQLRRDLNEAHPGQTRNPDSLAVPPGYKDAVADYFRRLSSSPRKDRDKQQ